MKKEKGIYHKTFYCSDLYNSSDGEKIFDIFLVSKVQYCSNDRGLSWLDLQLTDRTGSMWAKVWSNRIEIEYEGYQGQIVIVSGRVSYYSGKPDFSVEKMRPIGESEFELSEIIKALPKEKIKIYSDTILGMKDKIVSEPLKRYVECFINQEKLGEMSTQPLHLTRHHTYRGALLEHICEVAVSAYNYARSTLAIRDIKYDLDLIIAGALLHDLGSNARYKKEGLSFYEDDNDKMRGNSYITHVALYQALGQCREQGYELDDTTHGLLLHIIDSAHGGVSPATMEAMIVCKMNRLSAEIEMFENICMKDELFGNDTDFLWSRDLRREITRMRRE